MHTHTHNIENTIAPPSPRRSQTPGAPRGLLEDDHAPFLPDPDRGHLSGPVAATGGAEPGRNAELQKCRGHRKKKSGGWMVSIYNSALIFFLRFKNLVPG